MPYDDPLIPATNTPNWGIHTPPASSLPNLLTPQSLVRFSEEFINRIIRDVATALTGAFPLGADGFALISEWATDLVSGVADASVAFLDLLDKLLHDPVTVIGELPQTLITGLNTALDNIGFAIQDLINTILEALTGVGAGGLPDVLGALGDLFDTANDAFSNAGDALADLASIITGVGGTVPTDVSDAITGAVSDAADAIAGVGDIVTNAGESLASGVGTAIANAGSSLNTIITNVVDEFGAVGSIAADVPAAINAAINNLSLNLRGLFGSFSGSAPPAVSPGQDAVNAVAAALAATAAQTAASVAALQKLLSNNVIVGNSIFIDPSVYANQTGLPSALFNTSSSGSHTASWDTISGKFAWTVPGSGTNGTSRKTEAIYKVAATVTDYQKVYGVWSSAPGAVADQNAVGGGWVYFNPRYAYNGLKARCNLEGTSFVEMNFQSDNIGLGFYVEGAYTSLMTSIAHTFQAGSVYALEVGTILDGLRAYRGTVNGTLLFSVIEVGSSSKVGTANEVHTVVVNGTPTGGTIPYTVGGQTYNIPYNGSQATVQAGIEALSSVGAGNVTVVRTGSGSGSPSYTWVITYGAAKAGLAMPGSIIDSTTGGTHSASYTRTTIGATYRYTGMNATAKWETLTLYGNGNPFGYYPQQLTPGAVAAWGMQDNTPPAVNGVQGKVSRVSASSVVNSSGAALVSAFWDTANYATNGVAFTASDVNEVHTLNLSGSSSGNLQYTITNLVTGVTTTSSAFAWNASTSTVQTAVQAMSVVGSGNCTVTGSAGAWVLTFNTAKAAMPIGRPGMVNSTLNGTPVMTPVRTTAGTPRGAWTVTDKDDYLIGARCTAAGAGGYGLALMVNGTVALKGTYVNKVTNDVGVHNLIYANMPLAAGDYIQVTATDTTTPTFVGAAGSADTWFTIKKMGLAAAAA